MSVNYCSSRPSTAQLEALYSGVGWSLYLAPGLLDACLDGSLWFETAWAPSNAESSSGEEPPEWPDGRPGAGPAVEQGERSGMSPGEGPGAGAGGGRRLVGLVRVVGDGASIAYVQDLLVHPDWQRRGIGARLLRDAMERFARVRQFLLLADDAPAPRAFYEAMGLGPVGEGHCVAYMRRGGRLTGAPMGDDAAAPSDPNARHPDETLGVAVR